jgi:hypothetical protein
MPKKRVWVRGGPEMKEYSVDVIVPRRLKKKETPPPPPDFNPGQEALTTDEAHRTVYSYAQHVEQADGNKES